MNKSRIEKIPIEYFDYFENIYLNFNQVRTAIDILVENVNGGGFHFESPEGMEPNQSEKLITFVNDFSKKIKLPKLLYKITTEIMVFGNSYIEKVEKGSNPIAEVNLLNPKTIAILTNEKQKLVGYAEVKNTEILRQFGINQIVHFKNLMLPLLGKGWYGRSQIEVFVSKLKEKFKIKDIPSF